MILCSLLVLHVLLSSTAAKKNASDHYDAKSKIDYYLDIAIEMARKAKDIQYTCPNCPSKAVDCDDMRKNGYNSSGIYTVWLKNRVLGEKQVPIFCDMETDGGGWTLIQSRGNFSNPQDYFFQDWLSYKNGFGDLGKEFWLGNDNIFALSNQKLYSIRFDLKDVEGNRRYACYDTFWIDDEDHKYTLHIRGYSGDAGDSMAPHNNQKFTTKDQDNDASDNNCAAEFKGGWWYGACHVSNLNGLNLRGKHESFADGVEWHSWKGYKESLATTEIKIRPKDFKQQAHMANSLTSQRNIPLTTQRNIPLTHTTQRNIPLTPKGDISLTPK